MTITSEDLEQYVAGSPGLSNEKRAFITDQLEDSPIGRQLAELYRKCEFPLIVDWGALADEEQTENYNKEFLSCFGRLPYFIFNRPQSERIEALLPFLSRTLIDASNFDIPDELKTALSQLQSHQFVAAVRSGHDFLKMNSRDWGSDGSVALLYLGCAALAIDDSESANEFMKVSQQTGRMKGKPYSKYLSVLGLMSGEFFDWSYAVKFMRLASQEHANERSWIASAIDRLLTWSQYRASMFLGLPLYREAWREKEISYQFAIAGMCCQAGDGDASILHADMALATADEIYPEFHPQRAIALSNYGHRLTQVMINQSNAQTYEHVQPYFQEAREILQKAIFNFFDIREAIVIHNYMVMAYHLGLFHRNESFFASAKEGLELALHVAKKAPFYQKTYYPDVAKKIEQSLEKLNQSDQTLTTISTVKVA